ncbi:MAG: hypothetical protein ED859_06925 [Desulfuromonadales bacterium]|nr:MAG: hypothetical protein ED859_06925 [Desulfuromonadales bacterium]
MKRIALIILLVSICVVGPASAATHHYYFNGIVSAVTPQQMTVSGRDLPVADNVKVVAMVQNNGAFFEEPARYSEISAGSSVSVMVEGAVVTRVIIERWKR